MEAVEALEGTFPQTVFGPNTSAPTGGTPASTRPAARMTLSAFFIVSPTRFSARGGGAPSKLSSPHHNGPPPACQTNHTHYTAQGTISADTP